ncbi:hypothetical protein [Sphingomonas sp. CFBP 13720]|uniref:hypothetical protein n=1 Tax=Sphingomonas sp. CFBP 13720 TaxID=2775302 RepID=UPI00177B5230|nr:hypothetical protein [Sphingomonas sp. CFBP 13720]MBD8677943.1 hypothetical protein [Sphingomonas sp. CFBP 13720]
MADAADIAAVLSEVRVATGVARAALPIAAGVAGECDECEWWMPRLIEGRCAFCRDGRPRPADWEPPVPHSSSPVATLPVCKEAQPMPAKSIQLPAIAVVAITAVEQLATDRNIALGQAAAELIERGIAAPAASAPVPALERTDIDTLLGMVRARFDDRDEERIELAAVLKRAEVAEARAAEAEAKLVKIRAINAE